MFQFCSKLLHAENTKSVYFTYFTGLIFANTILQVLKNRKKEVMFTWAIEYSYRGVVSELDLHTG